MGKMPDVGDSFVCGLLTVTVTEIEERRIAFAEVVKHPEPEDSENEADETENA